MNKLEDKIKELEERKEGSENSLFGTIFGSLLFGGISLFFFVKKIDEHWLKLVWIFAGLSGLFLIMTLVSWNSKKNIEKELKELKSKR